MQKSLHSQLLQWLLVPLFVISAVSSAVAYWSTFDLVREVYDKELLNSADSVMARVQWDGDRPIIEIPPRILQIVGHESRDDFYYQLSIVGERIIGNHLLPIPPIGNETKFSTQNVDGTTLRLVSMPLPGALWHGRQVMIIVGETRRMRTELRQQIFSTVMIPQIILIVCGSIAVWLGIGQGLRQLEIVRQAVAARSPSDLKPVDNDVPVEISPLIDALNRLFEALKNDLQRQSRFAANAAHQLRTPLAGLATYCQLASRQATSPKLKEVLTQMELLLEKMTNLVNQLLTLAQCEAAKSVTRQHQNVDLNAIAAGVISDMVPAAIAKQLELEFEPYKEPVIIHGNPQTLPEMIKNIIDNGIKYTAAGRVEVGVSVDEGVASIHVDDTGHGIDPKEYEKVFERFYRTNNELAPGTGLGLSIVKDVADTHNAVIVISQGSTGSGTRFTVQFARLKAAVEEAPSHSQNSVTVTSHKSI